MGNQVVEEGVAAAVAAAWVHDDRGLEEVVGLLDQASASPEFRHELAEVVDRRLAGAIADVWPRGWQPTDVAGVVGHRLSARHVRLAVDSIAYQARSYPGGAGADPAWLSQLDALGACTWWDASRSHLPQWTSREAVTWSDALRTSAQLLALLGRLPPIEPLGPPPSEWGTVVSRLRRTQGVDSRVLARVRSLLAKAESTNFPAEAEALSTKAQELMTRHSLDHAMLASGQSSSEEPAARRLRTDNPYAGAKAILLDQIARANRCRSVWSGYLGFCTLFGFPADIEMVEVLFTSLLVQGTRAMLAEGAHPGARRRRSRSFRQSFLVAYAQRIGERLREADAAGVESAEHRHGPDLLPVLRSRAEAVDSVFRAALPDLGRRLVSANDMAGMAAGRAAADMASLSVGEALQRPA